MENPCRIYRQRRLTFIEFSTKSRKVCMQIKVAYNMDDVNSWISANVRTVVGFDIEWRPNRWRGQNNPASLMQLSAGDKVLLIQLTYIPIAERLVSMLKDADVKKVGVGIHGDAAKMKSDWGLEMDGLVDISNSRCLSLKAVTEDVIGVTLTKNKRICTSDWQRFSLTPAQIVYAALDAWVASECYAVMNQVENLAVLSCDLNSVIQYESSLRGVCIKA